MGASGPTGKNPQESGGGATVSGMSPAWSEGLLEVVELGGDWEEGEEVAIPRGFLCLLS